ncbi:MAG: hypothetical protein Q7T91_00735 [Sulfuricurvum sp.]|nr:hypothetical protein [Sulfuricurvum sp.]
MGFFGDLFGFKDYKPEIFAAIDKAIKEHISLVKQLDDELKIGLIDANERDNKYTQAREYNQQTIANIPFFEIVEALKVYGSREHTQQRDDETMAGTRKEIMINGVNQFFHITCYKLKYIINSSDKIVYVDNTYAIDVR